VAGRPYSHFSDSEHQHPPGSSPVARKSFRRIVAPVERFLAIEAASGILLMLTSLLALLWANSPWQSVYADLWHVPFGVSIGSFSFERDLHFLINDGLMTVFFFVVGLEIRREMQSGELRDFRRAALPFAAALGGMLAPAAIFFALNAGRSSVSGWAVPTATDIAFAVGVLALLGKRVPPSLRILLLSIAVIDDVGAIAVIALFYSTNLTAFGFAILLLGVLLIYLCQLLGFRSPQAYLLPGFVVWVGAYQAGIHPALAGVIVGLMTPAKAWFGTETFLHETENRVRAIRSDVDAPEPSITHHLNTLQTASREAVSPLDRLQHQLHGWVAFGIMPLFAFANAGVSLKKISFDGDSLWVFGGVVLGLLAGKPAGILVLSWVAVRLHIAALPRGVEWPHVSVIGLVGGIGFTMALFVAHLAFLPGAVLDMAKFAILCGSGAAGTLAIFIGLRVLTPSVDNLTIESGAEPSRLET
jgi:NhaA family Na+:H+ antiporter